jgi:hypothetical protein
MIATSPISTAAAPATTTHAAEPSRLAPWSTGATVVPVVDDGVPSADAAGSIGTRCTGGRSPSLTIT